MSERFATYLELIPYLRLVMNGIISLGFGLFILNQIRPFVQWRLWVQCIVFPVTAGFLAHCSFEICWYLLQHSASAPADRAWLADHDGGGLIVVFMVSVYKTILLAAACAIFGLVIPFIKRMFAALPEPPKAE